MIIHVNGERRDISGSARLPDVLDLAPGESVPRGVAVAVNGEVVPRSRHADYELTDGARVEIVTAVQGG